MVLHFCINRWRGGILAVFLWQGEDNVQMGYQRTIMHNKSRKKASL
jgi:hypothetical protein